MNGFLRSIALLSVIRMMVDMLLPEGAMRRICEVITGLVLMQSMLFALMRILYGGFFG